MIITREYFDEISLNDMISGMVDNMSETDFDNEMKLFNRIVKDLHTTIEDCFVLIDIGCVMPEIYCVEHNGISTIILEDGEESTVTFVKEINEASGHTFYYFKNEMFCDYALDIINERFFNEEDDVDGLY